MIPEDSSFNSAYATGTNLLVCKRRYLLLKIIGLLSVVGFLYLKFDFIAVVISEKVLKFCQGEKTI